MKKNILGTLVAILVGLGFYYYKIHYPQKRSPEVIFTTAWGSINQVSLESDLIDYFDRFRRMKQDGTLLVFKNKKFVPASSYMEHFTSAKIFFYYEERINELKKLSPAEDGKPVVDAALDLYSFMDKRRKNDYPRIVEMMDNGTPKEEIDEYLEALMIASDYELAEKYDKLFVLITAYGDKHKIKYSVN